MMCPLVVIGDIVENWSSKNGGDGHDSTIVQEHIYVINQGEAVPMVTTFTIITPIEVHTWTTSITYCAG